MAPKSDGQRLAIDSRPSPSWEYRDRELFDGSASVLVRVRICLAFSRRSLYTLEDDIELFAFFVRNATISVGNGHAIDFAFPNDAITRCVLNVQTASVLLFGTEVLCSRAVESPSSVISALLFTVEFLSAELISKCRPNARLGLITSLFVNSSLERPCSNMDSRPHSGQSCSSHKNSRNGDERALVSQSLFAFRATRGYLHNHSETISPRAVE